MNPVPHHIFRENSSGRSGPAGTRPPSLHGGSSISPHSGSVCGFTILEVMVVVALVGIIISLAAPSFRNLIASRSVGSHVSDLVGSLRLARTESIKRGIPVSICRTSNATATSPTCANGTDWSSGWLIFVDRGADGALDATDFLIRVQQAYTNSGGIVQGTASSIRFLPSGVAPGAQGNFLFRPKLPATASVYSTLSRRVCVNSTGGTRLIEGEGACS